MIKNIVFDLGGVLLTEDDNWVHTNEVKNLLKVTDEQLSNGWESAWPDARDGKTNEDQFFETFLTHSIGHSNEELINSLKNTYRIEIDKYTAFPILEKLEGKYKLFALTNVTNFWLDLKVKKYELDKKLDLIISSCGEGIAKPHKEIFLALMNKAKIDPEETLFIDNMQKNIPPALELGFEVCLYTDLESLKAKFKELDIKI